VEKYVVSVQWSLDEVIRNKDGDSDDFSILDNTISQSEIIEIITNLVDRDKVEIKDFNANFINLFDGQKPSEVIISKLFKIAHDASNQEFINRINEAQKIVNRLENKNIFLENELTKEIKASEKLKNTIEQKEKQVLFFKSERTLNEDELVNLQHHIGINAELVSGSITRFKRNLDKNKELAVPKSTVIDMLDEISMANQKIIAINNYATKADFLTKSETINEDIISFIRQYISNIHPFISNSKIKISVEAENNKFIMGFKPMEITIILDNIINNARKAKAANLDSI
jgi:signal transduction histidine kinase